MVDVINGGYDAGIRFGGTMPEDMFAQRLSADLRWVLFSSPAYLEQHGTPVHPHDLMKHRCIRIRIRAGTGQMYHWELDHEGEEIAVDVPGSFIINDTSIAVSLAQDGIGLAYAMHPPFKTVSIAELCAW